MPWRSRGAIRYRCEMDAPGNARASPPRPVAGDEPFVPHPRQHHVTAFHRFVEVGPRRQRGRRAGKSGDQGAFRKRQILRGLAEHALGHGLDAVDAGAEENAIEIQLEDLLLGQLPLDEDREHGFPRLAPVTSPVRQEQRSRELLRDGAAAFDACPMHARCEPPRGPARWGRRRDAGRSGGPRPRRTRSADAARWPRSPRRVAARRAGTSACRPRCETRCRRRRARVDAPRSSVSRATRAVRHPRAQTRTADTWPAPNPNARARAT